MRYSTILFDADNTLFDFTRCEHAALLDALTAAGVTPDEGMIARYSAINDDCWKALERGEITKDRLRTLRFFRFCRELSLDLNVEALSRDYTDALAAKNFLIDGALSVCRSLCESCRLYIVTNGIAYVQRGRFAASALKPFFKDLFISEELGAEKPALAYFNAVFAAIPDFSLRDTLLVGDSLSSDMQGGLGAGLDTCWFDPQGRPLPASPAVTYRISALEELLPLVLGA